jgi:formate hydrogenlyase subunit 4
LKTAREGSSWLAEPAFLFGLIVLAWLTDSMSLSGMIGGHEVRQAWQTSGAALALVVLGWFLVLLVENCRLPFDNPHIGHDLTVSQEVTVLDQSDPASGMILYGAALKLLVFSALLVRVLLPVETGFTALDSGIFLVGLVLVAGVVGVVESVMARWRLAAAPRLLVAACLLSGLSVVLLMR